MTNRMHRCEQDTATAQTAAPREAISFCGRVLTGTELDLVRQVVLDFPSLSRAELAHTVCELLGMRRPNGRLKGRECVELLSKLQSQSSVSALPELRITKPKGAHHSAIDSSSNPQPLCEGPLSRYQPLHLQTITEVAERRLFQQYLQRYHPLGYRVPYGTQWRYFVRTQQPPYSILACLLFTSAAWKMAPRDQWIGWSEAARITNLPLLVNNSRFLILPWVRVPHLASHVLALAARQLPADWQAVYQLRPVLLETLVERPHAGTCYRAANWIFVGQTQGRGRMDRTHQSNGTRKEILLLPLIQQWRNRLCQISNPVRSS
jgi:Domain of unknown function (DUF4338)